MVAVAVADVVVVPVALVVFVVVVVVGAVSNGGRGCRCSNGSERSRRRGAARQSHVSCGGWRAGGLFQVASAATVVVREVAPCGVAVVV